MAACKARKPDGHACQAKARTGLTSASFYDASYLTHGAKPNARWAQIHRFRVIPSQRRRFDFRNSIRITEVLEFAANRRVQGELDNKPAYVLSYLADYAYRAQRTQCGHSDTAKTQTPAT